MPSRMKAGGPEHYSVSGWWGLTEFGSLSWILLSDVLAVFPADLWMDPGPAGHGDVTPLREGE